MVYFIAFAIYFQLTLQKRRFCLYAHKWFTREPISPHSSLQTWGIFILLITASLIGGTDYLMVALICIVLITGKVGLVFQLHPILLQSSSGAKGRILHVF